MPPDTTIDLGPSELTNDNAPTFTFSSTDPTAAFTRSIDQGIPSFDPCTTATSFQLSSNLNDGSWAFGAKAADPAGNSTTAARCFTVETNGPASGGCEKAQRSLANSKRRLRRANGPVQKKKKKKTKAKRS